MKKKFLKLFILLTLLFPFGVFAEELVNSENEMMVTLEKCIDGDTATFKDSSGNTYKTRFLAIDTPETVHPTKEIEAYGKEASAYTCDTLTNAKEIKLELDPGSDKEDKYGRLLAWVFADGVLLQNSLLEKGLAEVSYLYGNYKYTEMIQETQEVAKEKQIGIWSDAVLEETTDDKEETEEVKEEKGFIEKIIDDLLAKIFDYINELLDNIASYIENML